jgi:3-hydroxyacyl-CoA dehydrogenase
LNRAAILRRRIPDVLREEIRCDDRRHVQAHGAEGKAIRPSDIDVVWVNGYGWPVYRGGPMHYADSIGLAKVLAKMKEFQATMGDAFKPAPLLEKLAGEGKKFADMR